MNIFYLSHNPEECAQWHINRHMKLAVEAGQMLSTTLWELGIEGPYKPTHSNHPCRLWTKKRDNFIYTLELGLAICKEYTYRYDKIHASQSKLELIGKHVSQIPPGSSVPALAMPEEFRGPDPIESYRAYYRTKTHDRAGRRMDKWTKRNPPEWFYGE